MRNSMIRLLAAFLVAWSGLAPSFAAGPSGGSSTVVAASAPQAPTATFLPSVGTAPLAVYGARALLPTYNGPIAQIAKADATTFDLVQTATGLPDYAAATAWAAGQQVRVAKWYDQSGSGRHAVQTTFANMPLIDVSGVRGVAAAFGAFRAMVFDGWLDVPSGNVRKPKRLIMPAGVTFELQNHTVFMVTEPKNALYNSVYYGLTAAAGGATITSIGTAAAIGGLYASNAPSNTISNKRPRQNMQTLGLVSGVGSFKYVQDGSTYTASNSKWQQTVIGGAIGDDPNGSGDFLSAENFLAFVIYPAALTDANATLVRNALDATFGTTPPTGALITRVGDSIEYGPTVIESLEGRTPTRLMRSGIKGTPAVYGMGLSSQLLIGSGQLAANASTREFLLADTAFAKRILFIEIGTNDIGAGTTGAALYAALTTYIGNARAAGYTHIVVCTLLPRTQSGAQQTQMDAYNALVRANSAGANAISDRAAHPVMGLSSVVPNTLFYQDALHPTGAGYELISPTDIAAVNSVLQ